MKLRRRLAIRYAMVVGVCLLLLAGLAHHEFVVEPHVRRMLGQEKPSGSAWGEIAEVVFHSLIPLVLGCGWWLMHRVLTPLDALAAQVDRIQAESLVEPLPRSHNGDEVDRLTAAFNRTTARLHQSFEQVRSFTLHASHELKTPLTVMRMQLESVLREDHPIEPNQREWMLAQLDEIQRLARLVDSMALLARADAGILSTDRSPVALDELVRELAEDAAVLGEAAGIRVVVDGCEPATVLGDRHRLRQLLLCLSDNAVKHNVPGGVITLSLGVAGGQAILRISNTGVQVPAEVCGRVFERFVRGPAAQANGVEGSGLGLAIGQSIVHAHGGSIRFTSAADGVTTVEVRLPHGCPRTMEG